MLVSYTAQVHQASLYGSQCGSPRFLPPQVVGSSSVGSSALADITGQELAPLMVEAEVGLAPDVLEAVVACVVCGPINPIWWGTCS